MISQLCLWLSIVVKRMQISMFIEMTEDGDEPKWSSGQHSDPFKLCHAAIFSSLEKTCVNIVKKQNG